MPLAPGADVTHLLLAWRDGDSDALEKLLPLVYAELHRLAHQRVRGEWAAQTLQTTALVHEAYLRLVDGAVVPWNNRAHFFAVCARLMRRILVDRARARGSRKRGGDVRHVPFQDWLGGQPARDIDIVALDEALTRPGGERPAPEPRRRVALLRRPDRGGDRGSSRDLARNRETRLEGGEALAAP